MNEIKIIKEKDKLSTELCSKYHDLGRLHFIFGNLKDSKLFLEQSIKTYNELKMGDYEKLSEIHFDLLNVNLIGSFIYDVEKIPEYSFETFKERFWLKNYPKEVP